MRCAAALAALAPLALAGGPAAAWGAEQEAPTITEAKAAGPTQAPSVPPPGAGVAAGPGSGARMELAVARGINGRNESALSGTRLRVEGTLSRYVAGQQVTVRTYRRGKMVGQRAVAVLPGDGGTGRFALAVRVVGSGHFVLRASHGATAQQGAVRASGVGFDVLPTRLRRGDRGSRVSVVQKHLRELGYVPGRRGAYDARTRRAVLAFRKVTGMRRSSSANRAMLARLAAGHGRFRVRRGDHGRHLEADLSRQVIALIGRDGRVQRIYPTSTGARATPTVTGSFRVYRKDPGTNAKGMVHSVYFIGGYAVHGFRSVPTYPASHGCLRIPIPDARTVYDWMRRGTRVDVYR